MVARGLRLTTVAPLSSLSQFLCLPTCSEQGKDYSSTDRPCFCCRTQHYTPCCWLPNNFLKRTS